MKRILKPLLIVIATIYFLVDVIFITVARPIANWMASHWMLARLRGWIQSLRPYPTLMLFAVPVIVLEPVKPVALYLAATGHVKISVTVLVIGELLKLVLIERLFSLSRDKLMTIPAFRWAYLKYAWARDCVVLSEPWQAMLRISCSVKITVRRYVGRVRRSQQSRRISMQSR